MQSGKPVRHSGRSAIVTALGAAAIAAIAGFACVYVTLGRPDNGGGPPAAPAAPRDLKPPGASEGASGHPLSQGQMAAFIFRREPAEVPEVKFQDGEGKDRTLAEWRGRVVLLNLWATWCLPCRKEMPALDRLQQELGSDRFEVVALSVDRTGLAGARKFLDETKVQKLALYADSTAGMASKLHAAGLPVTLLLDRQGREVGRLLGPAEWDGEDAKRLIGSVLR